jgi:hypothetical protein
MTRTEEYLLNRTAAPTVKQAVERLCAALAARPAVAAPNGRVDVDALAASVGLTISQSSDGMGRALARLVPGSSRMRIVVRPGLSRSAARFAIAHEVGHTFFFERTETGFKHTVGLLSAPELRAEERICDRFARAMLIPASRVEAHLDSCEAMTCGGILVQFDAFARTLGVGIKTLILRCSDLRLAIDDVTVVCWEAKRARRPSRLNLQAVAVAADRGAPKIPIGTFARDFGLGSCSKLLAAWNASRGQHSVGRYSLVSGSRLEVLGVGEATESVESCAFGDDGPDYSGRANVRSASAVFIAPGGSIRNACVLTVARFDAA